VELVRQAEKPVVFPWIGGVEDILVADDDLADDSAAGHQFLVGR
jgi:hypothetical protein